MSYSIDRYNGTIVAVVEDGTIDNTLDIKLIGKNYAGYGEVQNENFVHLLEHFAGPTEPSRKITGQIWYNNATKKLQYYTATGATGWKTTGGAETGPTPPTSPTLGDFWWDTANDQLFSWSGTEFILVGPQGVSGSGTTQMKSRSVKAAPGGIVGGTYVPIIQAIVDDSTIYIISKTSFEIDQTVPGNTIVGFGIIKAGITLKDTNNEEGITTSATEVFHGTSTNALALGGVPAGDFLGILDFDFSSALGAVGFNDSGLTVGGAVGSLTDTLIVKINSSNPLIKSSTSLMTFQTTSGSVKTPLTLSANNILPGADSVSNIGSASFKYATVYATSFNGPATQADSLSVGGSYRLASTSAGVDTVAARDNSGNLTANVFNGTATAARYADLAEKYLADAEYEVGTVVMIGGEAEVTAAQVGFRAIGAVSANPAHLMNSELEGGTAVALKGRVPVKVTGSVIKGQRLVAGPSGTAQAAMGNTADVFAIALESSDDTGVKLVEALVL
jgi:hypothetical protein